MKNNSLEADNNSNNKHFLNDNAFKAIIFTIIGVIALVLIVVLIAYIDVYKRTNEVCFYINDRPVTKLEYDYYYNTYYNSYLSEYSFMFEYMDIDPNMDLDAQMYDNDRTFGQYFDDCAKDQIIKITALHEDGIKNGFDYDVTNDYVDFTDKIKSSCNSAGVSTDAYYKRFYGKLATERNIKQYLNYGFYANAYYSYLCDSMNKDKDDLTAFNYTASLKDAYEITY